MSQVKKILEASEKIKAIKAALTANVYSFEIDTTDVVFGFKKTLKKRTSDIAKANQIARKLSRDCGGFISDSVKIVAVRMYKNKELIKAI